MNILEHFVYDIIKRNQKVKNIIRDSYQFIFSLWPEKKQICHSELISRKNYFFGFHDKSPWSYNNQYLLANRFSIKNRAILPQDFIEIGFFYGDDYLQFVPIDSTCAFNWQQGCMLQWIGKTESFIFNSLKRDKHFSIVKDINGKLICEIPQPISALDLLGKYALSYDFVRLSKYYPGYGYENGFCSELDVKEPDTGLLIIDLENGDIDKLFSVKEIAYLNRNSTMEGAYHFFSHCSFSPSGDRIAFYHRWIKNDNYVFTRLFTCNIDGSKLYHLPTNQMVSHYCWKNNKQILAYCNTIDYGDGYYIFDDQRDTYYLINPKILDVDGHPSFCPYNHDIFVTDTYPNRYRQSRLILYNLKKENKIEVGLFKQPLKYKNELRCDLHPRWDRKGTMICFDSAHDGIRSLCTINVSLNELFGQ